MSPTVCTLVVGPERHGVVRFARELATAIDGPTLVVGTVDEALALPTPDVDRVHVHFTDRLFGTTATLGADEFVRLADGLNIPVGVTLHDVPQPSDGTAYRRRADAYRRVVEAADGIVASSDHERRLLAEVVDPVTDVHVIPLAVEPSAGLSERRPPQRADVGVLGFIYPGKGHAEVIDALAGVGGDVGLVAIGAVSDGHDHLVTELRAHADGAKVRFETTGFVADTDLTDVLRSVAVPVAFHRHLSASGSITSWIGAGRRPLVPTNRYTAEIEARSPGTLWVHGNSVDDLRSAIAQAVSEPDLTWTADGVVPFPSVRQAADMYLTLFDEWSRR